MVPILLPCRRLRAIFPKLGDVVNEQGRYRAVLYARALGSAAHIRGPGRGGDKKRAFEDLLAIRDAAADETTRMGALQAMKRAADRLKEGRAADRLKADSEAHTGGVELLSTMNSVPELNTPRMEINSRLKDHADPANAAPKSIWN